jgi:adenylyl-sulfate kinase
MTGGSPGFTLWLTGLSGAGKTTLARRIAPALSQCDCRVEVLDGDEVRQAFGHDLGHTPADRAANMRRMGFMARLLSRNGVAVVVAAMSPYRRVRDEIRRDHDAPFLEVFVDCGLDELTRRDTKGLYARGRAGELQNVIGLTDAYEPSPAPDVHLHTDTVPVEECVASVLAALRSRGLIRP